MHYFGHFSGVEEERERKEKEFPRGSFSVMKGDCESNQGRKEGEE